LFKSGEGSNYENLAFKITVDGEKDIFYYGTFRTVESEYPIIFFSTDNFPFDQTKVSGISRLTTQLDKIYLGSLPKDNGKFEKGQTSKIRFLNLIGDIDPTKVNNGSEKDRIEFNISKIEILCNKSTGDPYLGFKNNYLRKNTITNQQLDKAKNLIKTK
jgi:hypothetical protein